jgi:hypothetical protein
MCRATRSRADWAARAFLLLYEASLWRVKPSASPSAIATALAGGTSGLPSLYGRTLIAGQGEDFKPDLPLDGLAGL